MIKILFLFFLILPSCSSPFNSDEVGNACVNCKLDIYCELPQDSNGVYLLQWNENLVQTYTTVYAETDCGWAKRIQWDTNYRYYIGGQYVRLINNSSMTDDEGNGRIIFGAWEPFIGYTITCYGGYMDSCDEQHLDSLKIKLTR